MNDSGKPVVGQLMLLVAALFVLVLAMQVAIGVATGDIEVSISSLIAHGSLLFFNNAVLALALAVLPGLVLIGVYLSTRRGKN